MEKAFMAKNITKMKPAQTKLADATAQETPPEQAKSVKDPDLAEFIDVFGPEKGIELYQAGEDIAQVRQLKELLDKFGVPGTGSETTSESSELSDNDPKPPADSDTKKEDEPAQLSSMIQPLVQSVTKLSGDVAALKSAIPRGETQPLHHGLADSKPEKPSKAPETSVDKMAAKFAGKKVAND